MSSFMLFASDSPLREVPYPPDLTVDFDTGSGAVIDGGMDDGFAIFPRKPLPELPSEKRYLAVLEWRYTPGRAEKIIGYLKEHLASADELEFWHTWQDMDFGHRVRKAEIPIGDLTIDDIRELDQLEVSRDPVTDYCYIIKR